MKYSYKYSNKIGSIINPIKETVKNPADIDRCHLLLQTKSFASNDAVNKCPQKTLKIKEQSIFEVVLTLNVFQINKSSNQNHRQRKATFDECFNASQRIQVLAFSDAHSTT